MKFITLLHQLNNIISRFMLALASICMAAIALIMTIQVLFRYLFSSPIAGAEELSIYLSIYLTFLAFPYITKFTKHITMTLLIEKLPVRGRALIELLQVAFLVAALIYWLPLSLSTTEKAMGVLTNQLPFSRGVVFIVMPISFFVLILVALEQVLASLLSLVQPQKEPELLKLRKED